MPDYRVPLKEQRFLLEHVFQFPQHYASYDCAELATPDVVDAVLEEAAKFVQNELVPLNASGDAEGCHWEDGKVTTPAGFVQAYQKYVEGGWPSLAHDEQYGGQGLPESLGLIISEMIGSANWAWGMYPGLSHGAMNTLHAHGTEAQKNQFLPKLVSGEWTGTMCLTEAHCGTDLGLLKTKAEPHERGDGSYRLTGSKIFISAGEHDLSQNIIHIVLARLPDAPEGVKGISLFIVPKILVDASGELGERNSVRCGSLEHKMGIHANATCVMNFDAAEGYLIGPPNRGLQAMFTFMNTARVGTALQGLAHAEWALQNSVAYAQERLQMRSLSGAKAPEKPADPIIVHPDVRRMLLTQKAFAEGGRAFLYYLALQVDLRHKAQTEEARQEAEDLMAILTPIAKAFLTETGFEAANLGMQVYGGHGYIKEWGMEQNVRDSRISMLYEGTTGIQALDLLGRKVLLSKGRLLKVWTRVIHRFCRDNRKRPGANEFIKPLWKLNKELTGLTRKIGFSALRNRDAVGAASVDYLMYAGYITLAYFWAVMAAEALEQLKKGEGDARFLEAKVATARFYYARILPRAKMHLTCLQAGGDTLLALPDEDFLLGVE